MGRERGSQGPDHTESLKKIGLYSKSTRKYKESCELESMGTRCSSAWI